VAFAVDDVEGIFNVSFFLEYLKLLVCSAAWSSSSQET
jgi:hypothetical protein